MFTFQPSVKDERGITNNTYQYAPAWFGSFVLGRLSISITFNEPNKSRKRKTGTTLYNRLNMLRMEHGMSQQDLARALDISNQTVIALERDEYSPSLELTLRISQLFALPVETIFFLSSLDHAVRKTI